MMPVAILLLICAQGLPTAQCTVETAEVVLQGPEVATMAGCGLHGQAFVAETALREWLADGNYLKVQCRVGTRP